MAGVNRPTTNMEGLEPALAGRPGRIDQAIEIGLPEDRKDFERALGDMVRSGGKLGAKLVGGEAAGFVR